MSRQISVIAGALLLAMGSMQQASSSERAAQAGDAGQDATCQGFGPQTPRDITQEKGRNPVVFPMAGAADSMNLCNIHYHGAAEHRAPAFSTPAGERQDGQTGGFACGIAAQLTPSEKRPLDKNACKGISAGDTIEVHWVYSSCDVQPGSGLGACLSDKCANPSLRVEAQVFTVVNDDQALDFQTFAAVTERNGYHQPAALPSNTGTPVEFLGSTTGSSYSSSTCSPLQVSWSVRPQCAKVSLSSLSKWCADNPFDEDEGHGVRALVTAPELLAPIKR